MKKYICAVLAALLLVGSVSLSSCSKKPAQTEETTDAEQTQTDEVVGDTVLAELLCDTTEIAAGDLVDVTVRMNAREKVACFQFEVVSDKDLVRVESEQLDVGGFIVMENPVGNTDTIAGYVAAVEDVEERDFYLLTYMIPEEAESGDEFVISLNCSQYLIGLDEYGDETKDLCAEAAPSEVRITVK